MAATCVVPCGCLDGQRCSCVDLGCSVHAQEAQPLYRRAKKPMAGKAAALIQKWRAVSTSGSPDE